MFKFRASSLGLIMTDPKGKDEVLSVGAKTEIEKLATSIRQAINFEETIDGLDLIFSQDFKADFDLLKKESPSLFQELVDEIEKKRQSL